jgi:hypothetical protein
VSCHGRCAPASMIGNTTSYQNGSLEYLILNHLPAPMGEYLMGIFDFKSFDYAPWWCQCVDICFLDLCKRRELLACQSEWPVQG